MDSSAGMPLGLTPPPTPQPGSFDNPTSVQIISQYAGKPEKARLAGILIGVVVVFVTIVGGVFGVYRMIMDQTEGLKSVVVKQIGQFDKLQEKNSQLLGLVKSINQQTTNQGDKNSVLGVSTQDKTTEIKKEVGQVLGLEDELMMKLRRQLIEELRSARNILNDISVVNDQAKGKSGNVFLMLANKKPPIEKTAMMVRNVNRIFDYLEKSTNLEIEIGSAAYDFGISLGITIVNPDESGVKRLEDSIGKMKVVLQKYRDVDLADLPFKLQEFHQKNIDGVDKQMKQLDSLPAYIRSRDGNGLKQAVLAFTLESVASSQTLITDFMNFWQNDESIRSVGDLRQEWERYKAEL